MNDYSIHPPIDGFKPLIQVIQSIERNSNNRRVQNKNIALTNGVLSSLFYLLLIITNTGDPIIVNCIVFEGILTLLKSLRLKPIMVSFQNTFQLEVALKKTGAKVLILNSPENPSGKIFDKYFLSKLNTLARTYKITVISDEVNNQRIYSPFEWIAPSQYIDLSRLVTLNSVTKNFYLPGVRLGWMVANEQLIKKYKKIIAVSQVAIGMPQQILAYEQLKKNNNKLTKSLQELQNKKKYMERILQIEKLEYLAPVQAGSVFFINLRTNATVLNEKLLRESRVSFIPGIYFGNKWKNWGRFGFGAVTKKEIKKGLCIIKNNIQRIT
ncbi:MAG: pyridoxal phosphate-dependent aminotransferase [Candidatus Roizmanbacteria bacterium]|nr:pyridoxal phosphate-dependent aminotransferase [Candidatus Roizmanbacteria bacterium]